MIHCGSRYHEKINNFVVRVRVRGLPFVHVCAHPVGGVYGDGFGGDADVDEALWHVKRILQRGEGSEEEAGGLGGEVFAEGEGGDRFGDQGVT